LNFDFQGDKINIRKHDFFGKDRDIITEG